MSDSPQFGIPGVALRPGEHICALYLGDADRNRVMLPYLREGLSAGDKCLLAIHEDDSAAMLSNLRDNVDVQGHPASQQLEVRTAKDPLLTADTFSTEGAIAFWDSTVRGALDAGFPFVRLGAEASWWMPQLPGLDEFFRYESELNRFISRYPQAILCMYDLEQYSENIVLDLLKTHPQVLMCGVLLENPYYLTPDEFLATRF
jgi:hypothetical protein